MRPSFVRTEAKGGTSVAFFKGKYVENTNLFAYLFKYRYGQLGLEGPTDGHVQFISKLDRKHCRMLIRPPTGHINLQHMLHRMRKAKTPSCGKYGAEKEMSVHILANARC